MRSFFLQLLMVLAAAVPALAQSSVTAFVGVNVLPMDRERVLEDQTVLIQDGVIQQMAPSHRMQVPAGAQVIDGEGMFLMPGLADMHVTLPGAGIPRDQVDDIMFLYLANNITVLRGMNGSPGQLQLKRDVGSGAILGPTLFVGSPPLDPSLGEDPDAAVARMLANRSAGYDLQVVRSGVSPMVWDSLAEEAHSRGFSFGGTLPDSITLRHALSSGISSIESMDGYLEEVVSDEVRARLDRGAQVPIREMLESAVGRKMRAMAAHTRSSDSWIVPTMHLWEDLYRPMDLDSVLASPEMRFVSSSELDYWATQKAAQPAVDQETAALLGTVRGRLLRALTMAGVGCLMGTGTPQMFQVPGFSLRHELGSMEAAGLTPYEILVTGTRNVAEYARDELLEPGNFGKVAEGNRADLILLRANPFQDLEALWDQEGVMVRGRWIPREEMDARLERIATGFEGSPVPSEEEGSRP